MTLSKNGPDALDALAGELSLPARRAMLHEWTCEYARTRDGRLRDRLILHHQALVKVIASRFVDRGEPLEDLMQVGTMITPAASASRAGSGSAPWQPVTSPSR